MILETILGDNRLTEKLNIYLEILSIIVVILSPVKGQSVEYTVCLCMYRKEGVADLVCSQRYVFNH